MKRQQDELMVYDPATGDRRPYPSHAEQWRAFHGSSTAWLFNPWTGARRDARDVGSDVYGFLILPPDEDAIPLAGELVTRNPAPNAAAPALSSYRAYTARGHG